MSNIILPPNIGEAKELNLTPPPDNDYVKLKVSDDTLRAVQEMFDVLGSDTKSDTVDLCIQITYLMFKEIERGGEVFVKHSDGSLSKMSIPGLDVEHTMQSPPDLPGKNC